MRRLRAVLRSRHRLRALVPAALLAVVIGGGALALTETATVASFRDGLWWSLSLITTVGFVGHVPTTDAGRLISGFLMVGGFVLMAMTTAAVASLFVREDEQPDDERDRAFQAEMRAELWALRHEVQALRRQLGATSDGAPPR